MSCYNGAELPPSLENASQSPVPPSRCIGHSFVLRVPAELGGSQLPSPQVKRQNNGHDHPQEQDKGKPGLHKSPYAARWKKVRGFKH